MIKIKSNNIVLLDSIFSGYIYIENGKIIEVSSNNKDADEEYDYSNRFVAPGFIEMHTHGCGGYPFINNTVEDVVNACNTELKHGVTSILPTITAAPFNIMEEATKNVVNAIKTNKIKSNVLGVHMEGPYLSKEQCGAQCPTFIKAPDKNEYVPFVNEYGKYIKKWTYAAENDKNQEFVRYLVSNDIIASIGHSNAKYDDVKLAVENGANMITHFYSCMSTITRENGFRKLGVIECGYLFDELKFEVITDGIHVPVELLKILFKNKGIENLVMVTDSLAIADTDIKEGVMSGTEYIVEDDVCKLKDRSAFAGSVATEEKLIKVAMQAGATLPEAIRMLTYNPAQILNVKKGLLKEGYDADIVVLDDKLNVASVFVNGKYVY